MNMKFSFDQRFRKESPEEIDSRLYEAYLHTSDEKINEAQKLLAIVSRLPKKEAFLDIGAGLGQLTIPLSRMFKNSLAVEPNTYYARKLQEKAPGLQIINEPLQKTRLGSRKFDFILCSHVLNFIPQKDWLKTIEKLYALLDEGGKLALVIQSPEGDLSRFFEEFTGELVNIFPLWGKMLKKYGDSAIKADYFKSQVRTRSLHDMIAVGLYFLNKKKFQNMRGEIAGYFSEHHQNASGFVISQDEILITLTKEPNARRK